MKKLKQLIKEKARLLFGVEKEVVSESDLFHSEAMNIVDKYYKGDATVSTEIRNIYGYHTKETQKEYKISIITSREPVYYDSHEDKEVVMSRLNSFINEKIRIRRKINSFIAQQNDSNREEI